MARAFTILWLEENFYQDADRTLDEILAILLALKTLGESSEEAFRPAVSESFLRFIEARPPLSGLVAENLKDWNCWRAESAYRHLLQSGSAFLPSTREAIQAYLSACP